MQIKISFNELIDLIGRVYSDQAGKPIADYKFVGIEQKDGAIIETQIEDIPFKFIYINFQ